MRSVHTLGPSPFVAKTNGKSLPQRLRSEKASFRSVSFGAKPADGYKTTAEVQEISKRGWGDAFKEGVKAMGPFFTDWKLTGQAFQVIVAGIVFGAITAIGSPLAIVTIPMSIGSLAALYLAFDFVGGLGREREMQNKAREILSKAS